VTSMRRRLNSLPQVEVLREASGALHADTEIANVAFVAVNRELVTASIASSVGLAIVIESANGLGQPQHGPTTVDAR